MSGMRVVRSADRDGWTALVDPPGAIPSAGSEITAFTSRNGSFTCGFWEREPDAWPFARAHDEVAYVLSGSAEIETAEGRTLEVGPGDVLVTPNGSKGTWRIHETLLKCYAVYVGGPVGESPTATVFRRDDEAPWEAIPTAQDDPHPPGEEWTAFRSPDGRFVAGVWRRVPETGPMELAGDEVALLIEGNVEVSSGEDAVELGPGDLLVTPRGFAGTWRARSPVRKFWAVHHE